VRAKTTHTDIGIRSCPMCHAPLLVKTNKHGYPGAYCTACDTQFQPRADIGSLLLLGRVHTWTNQSAAAVLIEPADRAALQPSATLTPPRLPPHLSRSTTAPATATPSPRKSWLDRQL
jgi:hypothetical protein